MRTSEEDMQRRLAKREAQEGSLHSEWTSTQNGIALADAADREAQVTLLDAALHTDVDWQKQCGL